MNVMPNKHLSMDTPYHLYEGKHFDYTQLRPFWSRCYVWQDPAQRAVDGAEAEASAKLQAKAKPHFYVGILPGSNYLCFDTEKGKLKVLSKPRFSPDYDLMSKTLHNSSETLVDPTSTSVFTRALFPIRRPESLSSPDILDIACSTHGTETFGYVKVQCAKAQHPVWVKLLHYLTMAPNHYRTLMILLRHRQKHGSSNPFYPVFALCSTKPPDRQKYHLAVIVSVDHDKQAKHRFQVFFDTADEHNTAYTDTDAVIIDPAVKAMLLALRDSDTSPSEFPDDVFMDEPDPTSLKQADMFPNRKHWHDATHAEIEGILQPERSDAVTSFPPGATVLLTKFVFMLKKRTDGTLDKFKSRCTTRGDLDKTFYDERDVFAPTPALTAFRLFLSLCILHCLMPYHYDVSQAFLQADIPENERYYVRFPKGYTHPKGYIGAFMKRALYGHRASGKLWADTAHAFFAKHYPTLIRSTYDECLYLGEVNGQKMMVLVYVDDFLIGCAHEHTRAQFHSSLMTTFTATYSVRPDIYYHVTYLAQFCHQPTVEAFTAAKRILHYCYTTRDYTLTYRHDPTQPQLNVFCDSDHAGDTITRNSVSGYCLYFHGMLIDWWSKKQRSCTTLHSTEAEYVAMSEACTSALAIYNTIAEFFETTDLITINVDNSAVQHLVGSRTLSSKLKHVAVRFHAVRRWCQGPQKIFRPVWIPTDENQADIFTKALPITKHGVPIIDKFTDRLLDIGDRAVKLREQLRAAAAQKLRGSTAAAQQLAEKLKAQDQQVLASLQRLAIV
ncbi:hypothetical protein CYMTET_11705 [Cymbomonas tetramitiformis]|uniref:Reverse transcriptase Ty1/copia-type domain-containing protein n=1 Tax=Cymbomonas tetramitiformis TaxID=36881 RepID=A0AAE0GLJ1_9CHLO|nr:hypothetical protein CYMTET_11705 [Cymbomonas tetramitiformis]